MTYEGRPSSIRRMRLRPLLGAVGYLKRGRSRCFVCAFLEGDPGYSHHLVYEDASSVAFLDKGPRLWGTVLVAPKDHREHVTGDFTAEQYLGLQRVVYRVGEAVRTILPCERLYIMSMGSQQLNRHVHWHVAPLPPGVRLPLQQLRAFSELISGVLVGPDEEFALLAQRIREELLIAERHP